MRCRFSGATDVIGKGCDRRLASWPVFPIPVSTPEGLPALSWPVSTRRAQDTAMSRSTRLFAPVLLLACCLAVPAGALLQAEDPPAPQPKGKGQDFGKKKAKAAQPR